jgi:hypothetical protein
VYDDKADDQWLQHQFFSTLLIIASIANAVRPFRAINSYSAYGKNTVSNAIKNTILE